MAEIKFKTIFKTEEGCSRGCLAALGDAWKRNAPFDRPELAKQFNALSKRLCAGVQYWDMAENMEWPLKAVRESLTELAEIAAREDIERVILPVAAKSPAGKFIARQLREVGGFAGDEVVLHEDDYYVSRLHHLGRIDQRRKTGLDLGLLYRKDM